MAGWTKDHPAVGALAPLPLAPVGMDPESSAAALGQYAAEKRDQAGEALHSAKEAVQTAAGSASACGERVAHEAKSKASDLAAEAKHVAQGTAFQTTALSAAGGAVAVGSGGAAAGLATGAVVGASLGLAPALFTFGISIPVGAAIGGSAGFLVCATGGAAVGALGGGVAGYGYNKREHIACGARRILAKAKESVQWMKKVASKKLVAPVKSAVAAIRGKSSEAKVAISSKADEVQEKGLKVVVSETAHQAGAKASGFAAGMYAAATNPSVQVTAISAAGGATVVGTGGGVAGLAVGTVLGATMGLVPAIFTFGLSIPIGAVIGGGTGLVTGAAAGTALGAVGGAASGYGAYAKRESIASAVGGSVHYLKHSAAQVRARMVGSGTGGTEGSE